METQKEYSKESLKHETVHNIYATVPDSSAFIKICINKKINLIKL